MQMALRCCLQRHQCLTWYSETLQLERDLKNLLSQRQQRALTEKKRRKRQELFWELDLGTKEIKRCENAQKESEDEDGETQQQKIRDRLLALKDHLLTHLPDIVSRLEYAADALFQEAARGFFLPFCTVALGCAARIRALLLNLCGDIMLGKLPELHALCQKLSSNPDVIVTDRELTEIQQFLASSSATTASSCHPSRADVTASSLRSLGIVPAPRQRGEGRTSTPETSEAERLQRSLPVLNDSVQEDRGESATAALLAEEEGDRPVAEDQNAALVQQFQQKKAKSKAEDNRKQKDEAKVPRDKKKRKKRKKSSKAKGGNFLDELFG
jgi:hypothetical protein